MSINSSKFSVDYRTCSKKTGKKEQVFGQTGFPSCFLTGTYAKASHTMTRFSINWKARAVRSGRFVFFAKLSLDCRSGLLTKSRSITTSSQLWISVKRQHNVTERGELLASCGNVFPFQTAFLLLGAIPVCKAALSMTCSLYTIPSVPMAFKVTAIPAKKVGQNISRHVLNGLRRENTRGKADSTWLIRNHCNTMQIVKAQPWKGRMSVTSCMQIAGPQQRIERKVRQETASGLSSNHV